jgi:hypothetical protein
LKPPAKEVRAAVELYESFREKKPKRLKILDVKIPRVVVHVGYVEAVDYRTTHGTELVLYNHKFAAGSRPLLCVSSDGRQLLLLGGRYQFTERGIVDKDSKGRQIKNPKHGKKINPRKYPSYTLAELEKFVAEGKGNPAMVQEIADRKAGISKVSVTPQILGGKIQTKIGRM